jgi:RHS repeat-associated protein
VQSWTNGVNPTVYVERDGLGSPLGLRIGTTDYAYVLDGLGSVVAIVGSNNAVVASYKYDPYGVVQADSHENGLGQSNVIRYAGGTYDAYTRTTKFGQRWYNPNQGRFTQQDNLSFIGDPKKGNRYAYAACNPVTLTDPTGQDTDNEYVNECITDGVKGAVGVGVVGALGAWLGPVEWGTAIAAVPIGFIGGCAEGVVGQYMDTH